MLHLLNPYHIRKIEGKVFTYRFITEANCEYEIYFSNVDYFDGFPEINSFVYSFGFYTSERNFLGLDKRVSDTIISVVYDFMQNKENIITFTCDNKDNKALARKKLFQKWFDEYNNNDFEKIDFDIFDIFSSIIFHKNYSQKNILHTAITQFIAEVTK